eukprot:1177649-Prorocentrum_minimum.AAC.5
MTWHMSPLLLRRGRFPVFLPQALNSPHPLTVRPPPYRSPLTVPPTTLTVHPLLSTPSPYHPPQPPYYPPIPLTVHPTSGSYPLAIHPPHYPPYCPP